MKTIPRVMLLVVLAGFCCMTLVAQDAMAPEKSKMAKPASEKKSAGAMPMPKPAPEMTKLIKTLSGNWTVTEKHEVNPMMPNGGEGKGTARIWAGPGGMSLIENYSSSGAMGSFKGMGTWWWDPKAQVYRGLWCDNMTPNGCDTSGSTKWEGDNLVGTTQGDTSGHDDHEVHLFRLQARLICHDHGNGSRRQQAAEGDDCDLHQSRGARENVGAAACEQKKLGLTAPP